MITHNFKLINADTDSIMISKQDGAEFTEEEKSSLLSELNSLFPDKINFSDDGYFPKVIILKAKNYILYDGKKIKKKGSSLRSSKTEKALSSFMDEVINVLLFEDQQKLLVVYNKYIKMVNNLTDIKPWAAKSTVTSSVLQPKRTNEQKKLDAIGDKPVSMGDKVYFYFTESGALKLVDNWVNDHDRVKLMKRIYSTLTIFTNVIDMSVFPKYHLKNKTIKAQLVTLLENGK